MRRQLIAHDYLAGTQARAQNLGQIGGEHGPVHGPIDAEQGPESSRPQGRGKRAIRPVRPGHGLVDPLPGRGTAVAAAVGQVCAGFIDEDEARHFLLCQGFEKVLPQSYDSFAVALGGVDAFFYVPSPLLPPPARYWCGSARVPRRRPGSCVIHPGWHLVAVRGRP